METILLYTIGTLAVAGFIAGLAWLEQGQAKRYAMLDTIHKVTK